MRKILMIILFVFVLSASSHAQWEIQHTNTEYTLRPVFFADANTGYVAGINRRNGLEFVSILLKTEDGGATWAQVLKVDTMRFQDVFFTNAKTGYLIGQAKKGERLLRTTDGGLTWNVQPTTYVRGRSFKQIHFTTPDNGIITGAYGMLMQTTDAGAHWTKLPEAPIELFNWVYCGQVGYAIGHGNAMSVSGESGTFLILKTTDGGVSWSILESSRSNKGYFSMACGSPVVAYTWSYAKDPNDKTDYSYLCKTTDGGTTWTKTKIRNMYTGLLYFQDANTGYNVTADSIHKTIDGGKSWRAQAINVNPPDPKYRFPRATYSICFPTPGTCIATAYKQPTYRTTTDMIIRLKSPKPQAKKGGVTKK